MSNHLIEPHGGELVDLMVTEERAAELKAASKEWKSWDLTPRQFCDVELLLCGAFSPLRGFMGSADYESVCDTMRLSSGVLWSMPITLDIPEELADSLNKGDSLALRDAEGVMIAALNIEEIYKPDLKSEAKRVYGTEDTKHPGVDQLLNQTHPCYVGGTLEGAQAPIHYDFRGLRQTPQELRDEFKRLGWQKVCAFQTRNPMHRAHFELTLSAAKEIEANLLIHPVVGMTKPGDVDHYTRVRCYEAILPRYPQLTVKLSLLPLAMRMAGPREAMWHAIIRKNFGCTHLIVGRDHAGPGDDSAGDPFYGAYDAQEMLREHEAEIGVQMVPFKNMVYVEEQDTYFPQDEVPEAARVLSISGTELRKRLSEGKAIPEWFTFPEVSAVLRHWFKPRHKQGFTVFFTGLSGSGKSTIANALLVKCLEMGERPTTLLDGDIVRKNLSSELGFSKEHRDINICRIGYVASEITKNSGLALCAPIAPYDSVRKKVREMIEPYGGFILVYVHTPIEVCEERDRKGLYAKARAGIIKEFTGISDPYEVPEDADVVIDTTKASAGEAAQQILLHLEHEGYVGGPGI